MTITLLDLRHVAQMKGNPDSASGHTTISIEYAISVLEEVLDNVLMPGKSQKGIHDKILELKALL
jgi:hypothetical protein